VLDPRRAEQRVNLSTGASHASKYTCRLPVARSSTQAKPRQQPLGAESIALVGFIAPLELDTKHPSTRGFPHPRCAAVLSFLNHCRLATRDGAALSVSSNANAARFAAN